MTARLAELLPKYAASPLLCPRPRSTPGRAPRLPLSEVRLQAPISDPSKILCVGLNYRDHATESKMQLPKGPRPPPAMHSPPPEPLVFAKFPNTLVGPDADVVCPAYAAAELDYEVEMVLVVGVRAYQVPESTALSHLGGVTVGNDGVSSM